jgi:nicotinamidase/pyrazinamidase
MPVSPNTIFWEVDVQVDFMLPGGALYVPGAESIIANITRLVSCARDDRVFLISSADAHNPADPHFREWPPHCMKGTPGAELLPEAIAEPQLVVPNEKEFAFPEDLSKYRQVLLQKNTLDVFDNPNTDVLLQRFKASNSPAFGAEPLFVLFGVATEYCVRCTAEELLKRSQRLAIVTDAVRAIDAEIGQKVLSELHSRGAQFIETQKALCLQIDSE